MASRTSASRCKTGVFLLVITSMLLAVAGSSEPAPAQTPTSTDANFKVAFIGDQGITTSAKKVLTLVKNEGAQAVIHSGDLDYMDNPTAWDDQINGILGSNFPYFISIGNHDVDKWSEYLTKFQARLKRFEGEVCTGELGTMSACTYKGLYFILSGAGETSGNHTTYISDRLAESNNIWKLCSWHRNDNAMQVGRDGSGPGLAPYEACRQSGAIVATAHEHSYQRTKTLTSVSNQTVDSSCADPASVCVSPGRTFVFVSGLGGISKMGQDRCLPSTYPYGCKKEWAKIYTSDQGARYGALFITFNVDSNPNKARGYFKNVDGDIVDSFDITSSGTTTTSTTTPTTTSTTSTSTTSTTLPPTTSSCAATGNATVSEPGVVAGSGVFGTSGNCTKVKGSGKADRITVDSHEGRTSVVAGGGADRICAQNGSYDVVKGGDGKDQAVVDPSDELESATAVTALDCTS